VAEKMYQQAPQQGQPTGNPGDNVVDADYETVD
jgi:hypothetical protein